jgi:hypothetical protein
MLSKCFQECHFIYLILKYLAKIVFSNIKAYFTLIKEILQHIESYFFFLLMTFWNPMCIAWIISRDVMFQVPPHLKDTYSNPRNLMTILCSSLFTHQK